MRKHLRCGVVRTDEFARRLLGQPAEFIRMIGIGRLWIVWDTNIRATVPTPTWSPQSSDPS